MLPLTDPPLLRLTLFTVSRVGVTSTPLPPEALPLSYAPGMVSPAPALVLPVEAVGAVVCEPDVFEWAESVGDRSACSRSQSPEPAGWSEEGDQDERVMIAFDTGRVGVWSRRGWVRMMWRVRARTRLARSQNGSSQWGRAWFRNMAK